jgi:hypothetical protein
MRKTIVALAALAMTAASATATVAQQKLYDGQPARVSAGNCGALAAQIGPARVWQTVFQAEREGDFGLKEWINAAPCFANESDCKAWLYWARTDWHPNYLHPQPCRPGIPY